MSERDPQPSAAAVLQAAEGVADEVAAATTAVAKRAAAVARVLGWDELLLLAMRRFHAPWRTSIARGLTRAGDAGSWTAYGITLLATGAALRRAEVVHLGLRLGAGTLIATALSQAMKRRLNRARPTSAIEGFQALSDNPDAFSFPSGHTTAAFAVAVAFAGEPWCAGPLALILAVGIGLSRVYLGAHYPFDVFAGVALGSASGALARVAVP